MSRFIATLKRKIAITEGDVIDDFIKLDEKFENLLVFFNFNIKLFISDDGNYGEFHGDFRGTTEEFISWFSRTDVKESLVSTEQPRIDHIKDSIEITRYLGWDDTGITTDFKLIDDFVTSDLTLTEKFVTW